MNINKVTIAGRLTKDPEIRFTPGGMACLKLGIATSRRYKAKDDSWKEETTFVDVDAFGKTAELLARTLKKGKTIYIEGRLRLETWDDKATGQKRSKMGVVLEGFQFVSRSDGEGDQPAEESERPAAKPATTAAPAATPQDDDDVPF